MTLEAFYSDPDLDDGFGIWPHPWRSRPHRGLDFAKAEGTPVPSISGGVVVVSRFNPGLGWVVEVRGNDGLFQGYCHLQSQGLPVGTWLNAGDIIGAVGDTGSESEGPHLHTTLGTVEGAVFGADLRALRDPWPYIQKQIEGDDMFTDKDRALLQQTAQKAGASYDALFKQSPTSRGEKAGVLSMTNAIYDAQFLQSETSRGTPEGVLGTLAIVLDQQALIMKHLGIEKATE